MTLNKYQKYNETIKLDDARREEILDRVMQTEIRPARRGFSAARWGIAGAAVFALILLVILPGAFFEKNQSAEDMAPASAEVAEERFDAEEEAVSFDAVPASGVLNFDGYNGMKEWEVLQDTPEKTVIWMATEGNEITITIRRKDTAPINGPAEQADEPVSARTFVIDGTAYELVFDSPVSSAEADQLEQYIREQE